MPSVPTLDYGPARPARRLRRRILIIVLLLTITILTLHYRRPLLTRLKLLIAQHRCMNYTAPADQLVFESDDLRGDQLFAQDSSHYRQSRYQLVYSGISLKSTFRQIPPWEDLCALFQPQKGGPAFPSPFNTVTNFSTVRSSPGDAGFQSIPVFLHQRRSTQGQSRLVVVDLDNRSRNLNIRVIRPASLTGTPKILSGDAVNELEELMKIAALFNDPNHLGVQFYAGQPDAADESRFSINVTIASVKTQLNGQLLPDETVKIEIPYFEQARSQIIANLDKAHAAPTEKQ